VHALQVVAITSYAYSGLIVPDLGETIEEMVKEANDHLKELADVDARAVYGLAGEELAAFGDQVDVLLVGSRSYGPVRRLVLGSTSDYLERHARCSLVVLPRAEQPSTKIAAADFTPARRLHPAGSGSAPSRSACRSGSCEGGC
jgi:nucleotide-binding universal stress UspA family protein